MAEMLPHTKTHSIQLTAIPLLEVSGIVEMILHQALGFCAEKMALKDEAQVIHRLRRRERAACSYWHYALAQQVAEQICTWDEDIQAAYVCTYDATPQDACFCDQDSPYPVHMIVWAWRKTAALQALVEAAEQALRQCCTEMLDAPPQAHVLDIQVVDDHEVENRLGYGALLSSIHNRPIQVWER